MMSENKKGCRLRKTRVKRTNLLSSTTDEDFKTTNEITKKQRGLSNLTYKKLTSK